MYGTYQGWRWREQDRINWFNMDAMDVDLLGWLIWFIDAATSFFCNATERWKQHLSPPTKVFFGAGAATVHWLPKAGRHWQARQVPCQRKGMSRYKWFVAWFSQIQNLKFRDMLCSQCADALTVNTVLHTAMFGPCWGTQCIVDYYCGSLWHGDTYQCKHNSQGSNPCALLLPRPSCQTKQ